MFDFFHLKTFTGKEWHCFGTFVGFACPCIYHRASASSLKVLVMGTPTFTMWTSNINSMCLGAQSCPILCDSMDCSPPGSSVHGTLQARILQWVAMPSSRGSSQPRDQTQVSCIVDRFFTIWTTREAHNYPITVKKEDLRWSKDLKKPKWT